jgi:protoporphyrinogen/coproporphyrinogen III oxidase
VSDSPLIVVGGGISGLAAAYELSRRDVPFLLVERTPRLGGVIRTERVGDFVIDAGPDALFTQKPAGIDLCRELGLGPRLSFTRSRSTFILRNGRLQALPEGAFMGIASGWRAFAATHAFSIGGKLRMAAEYLLPGGSPSDDESIASFIHRRFGREAVQYLADPLLAGVHGGDARRLSMRALFPKLLEMEQRDGSVIRGLRRVATDRRLPSSGPFVSLPNGIGELVEALSGALPRSSVRLGVGVTALHPRRGWIVELSTGECLEAAGVILAMPPHATTTLARTFDPTLATMCGAIRDTSVVTVALGYERRAVSHPLQGTGFVVPAMERTEVSAVTWVSSKWAGRAGPDHVLLRAYVGGSRNPGAVDLDDAQILGHVRDDLHRVLGITADPSLARIYRYPHATPQLEVGHLDVVSEIEGQLRRWPGLYVTAAGFRGVGIADCVADARAQATRAASCVTPRCVAV